MFRYFQAKASWNIDGVLPGISRTQVLAWSSGGRMIIAAEAYRQLSPTLKTAPSPPAG